MAGRRYNKKVANANRGVRSYTAGHVKGASLYKTGDQINAAQLLVLMYEIEIPSTLDYPEYRKGFEEGYCAAALEDKWDVKNGNQVTTDEMDDARKEFNKIFKTEQSALWGSTIDISKYDMDKHHVSEEEWEESRKYEASNWSREQGEMSIKKAQHIDNLDVSWDEEQRLKANDEMSYPWNQGDWKY